jgi:hypothetical protein
MRSTSSIRRDADRGRRTVPEYLLDPMIIGILTDDELAAQQAKILGG